MFSSENGWNLNLTGIYTGFGLGTWIAGKFICRRLESVAREDLQQFIPLFKHISKPSLKLLASSVTEAETSYEHMVFIKSSQNKTQLITFDQTVEIEPQLSDEAIAVATEMLNVFLASGKAWESAKCHPRAEALICFWSEPAQAHFWCVKSEFVDLISTLSSMK